MWTGPPLSKMSLSRIRQEDLKSYSVVDTSTEKVYKSTYGPTRTNVLIKLLSLSGLDERSRQAVQNHIEYISRIKSEHVTQMMGIYQTTNTLGIVTQWMPNGSLHSLIYQHDLYPVLPLSLCIRILRDVAEGLNFLHKLHPSIAHQRLKPCNILLDDQYNVKLSDVQAPNLPKLSISSDEDNTHRVYMSPQRLQGHEPTTADDIYSFVITGHELLNRKCPFHDSDPFKWETLVLRGHRPQPSIDAILKSRNLPQSQRMDLSRLINQCWHQDPNMRPTAAECLSQLCSILQIFPAEESRREMDNFVNKKEMAMQVCQSQTRTVEFHIRYLDDCWLTSHRSRTQSTPEGGTEVPPLWSEKKEKRSGVCFLLFPHCLWRTLPKQTIHCLQASLPVTNSTNGSHMPTMGHHPRTERNSRVCWTQVEPVGHLNPPHLLKYRNCVETLTRNLEVLLHSITEGHLNQLIDIMMSKSVLSRDDAEYINAEQTRKARIRKYIETCCEKGEEASRITLDSLLTRKIIYMNPVNYVGQ